MAIKTIKKIREPENNCFHCGLPVKTKEYTVTLLSKPRALCCAGCKAVAEAIVDSGMESYYSFREENAATAKEIVPEFLKSLQAYDNPLIQKQFVHNNLENKKIKEVSLILEGIVCSACVWLNEHYLSQLKGIVKVKINYSTHRATVQWNDDEISLSQILEAISSIGYMAHPYDVAKQQQVYEKQRSLLLRQVGVAGLFGMQTMMFAVALYSGDYWGISADYKLLFQWLSLFLTLPVLFFSAQPFFKGAVTDLKNKRAGMDVPVTLGISLAFISSVYNTSIQSGHVYFDSVCMFVFLLLGVRYIELMARKKSAENIEQLADMRPAMANIVTQKKSIETVPIAELSVDDEVLVRSGEYLPADGILITKKAQLDESLLTGESKPVDKISNQMVIAGSLNVGVTINVRVTKVGQDTVLSGILRLVEEAQLYKPRVAKLADKIASRFVVALIILVSIVGVFWFVHDATQAIAIMVATLVVTCPCALSLATPAAISATIGKSTSLGVLVSKTNALEQLEKVDVFLFDKTGTLTQGELSIESFDYHVEKNRDELLSIAKSLELRSEHPIASAFSKLDADIIELDDIQQMTGKGLSVKYEGHQYYLGSYSWYLETCPDSNKVNKASHLKAVYLFNENELLIVFYLNDPIKIDAAQTISAFYKSHKDIVLISGDQQQTVESVANTLGIKTVLAEQSPEQKLAYLKTLQSKAKVVAMVGDGINDAPVLSAANVALSMSSGTDLASASADLIVKSALTKPIIDVVLLSQKMNRIIKQNFAWALGYNVVAIPFAVTGMLPPWLAAIGMSLSSLVVVINAMRLKRN